MKTLCKRLVTVCLAFAMLVTMITPVTTEAATKAKKVTLYVGEVYQVSDYSTVKKVTSSKKAVASVAKDKSEDYYANITAKKPGTSTVTVKTKRATYKWVITVKKLDVTVSFKDMGDGDLLLIVKNKTKQTFDDVTISYTLKNSLGEVVKKDTTTVYNVVAGKTVFDKIYYSAYEYSVDASKCTAKAIADRRYDGYKYQTVSSKITKKVTEEDNGSDQLEITIKTKNGCKSSHASGYHYIIFYDAAGKVIDMKYVSFGLDAGDVDTDSVTINYGPYGSATGYSSYKVVTVAYARTYIK